MCPAGGRGDLGQTQSRVGGGIGTARGRFRCCSDPLTRNQSSWTVPVSDKWHSRSVARPVQPDPGQPHATLRLPWVPARTATASKWHEDPFCRHTASSGGCPCDCCSPGRCCCRCPWFWGYGMASRSFRTWLAVYVWLDTLPAQTGMDSSPGHRMMVTSDRHTWVIADQ